jgi:hypothetical protein
MSDSAIESLVGRRVLRIGVASDGRYIGFVTFGDRLAFKAVGDCCSRSWIEAVSNAENLIGEVVTKVEDRDMPTPEPQPAKYDCLAVYGHEIHTAKGTCLVEYRNDSNGYYGGWLEAVEAGHEFVATEVFDSWTCNDAEKKETWDDE